MARYRTVKPELFTDEKLAEVSIEARFLFVGLWCFCDDKGRKQYHPRRIRLEIFPCDDFSPRQVDGWIKELAEVGVIRLYSVEDVNYLWIPQFTFHQRIDRPSHVENPPHPRDPEPDCQCRGCKFKRGEDITIHVHRNGKRLKVFLQERPDSTTRGINGDESGTTPSSSSSSSNTYTHSSEKIDTYIQGKKEKSDSPTLAETNAENRRAESAALDKITSAILALLELEPNSVIISTLTESIRLRARYKSCSVEAAAQQISARAAFLNAGSAPEDWCLWFADSRYDYVPQGDDRLKGRNVSARPTCGGALCTDGWEIVNVQGEPRLRRCPDCAKLW